ncbi:hypothetical protein [Arthrobacter sp. MYb227]|uniref:hypothetical protein n=1 Tax=Arthrobacter sp. MYb227 TaxID=1848601 RepID=UPI0011B08787|nr:hypothetical protein [Arthrobacter sp. MYb227]
MPKSWGNRAKPRHHGIDLESIESDAEKPLISRRTLGITIGSALVLGSAGMTALAVAFAGSGPLGTTTIRTCFGQARISKAERQARLPSSNAAPAGHAEHQPAVGGERQPVNMTFGDHLLLQLEVFNDSEQEQMFSPGQLRVRGNSQPWLVVNRWNNYPPGLLLPGARIMANISFLVPSDATEFTAVFDDITNPGTELLELPLPAVSWRPGFLEEAHV